MIKKRMCLYALLLFFIFLSCCLFSCSSNTDVSAPESSASLPESEESISELLELGIRNIYINTVNKASISSNDIYTDGTISITDFDGNSLYSSLKARFKIRGNSTQGFPKKSYRIKLDDAADLLGLGSAENWMLVANYTDKSLMRNLMAQWMSKQMSGIKYSIPLVPVQVYLNGEYVGLYNLGDHIEVRDCRVDVETGSNYYDTGYFIEADIRAPDEDRPYFEVAGTYFSILSPKAPTDEQIEYITNYFKRVDYLLSIRSDAVWDYIDIDTCIDFLIVKETCCGSSMPYDVYIYKDADGKLCFGPVWDFDLAFGNADYGGADRYDRFYTSTGTWFCDWFEYDVFVQRFNDRWKYAYETVIPAMHEQMWFYYDYMKAAADDNFKRWDILDKYVWPNPEGVMNATTYEKQVEFLSRFLTLHTDWLNTHFSDLYS